MSILFQFFLKEIYILFLNNVYVLIIYLCSTLEKYVKMCNYILYIKIYCLFMTYKNAPESNNITVDYESDQRVFPMIR